MKFRQRLMRFISPESEGARLDFRIAAAHASATAEDLTRTLELKADEIREAISDHKAQMKREADQGGRRVGDRRHY